MGEPSALCLESEVRLSGGEASSTVRTKVEQTNLPRLDANMKQINKRK